MQRYRVLVVLGIVVGAAFGVATAGYVLDGAGSRDTAAIELPSACENFVVASELMAREGSHAAVRNGANTIFDGDPAEQSMETLRDLLESCDAELARVTH